jgi:modulator of FtsH protease HflK
MSDPKPNQPPPGQVPPAEEADSQALSDALRSSFLIVKIIMVVLLVIFLRSGFFTVGPQERAIVLRLGRPVGEGERALLNPGGHWAFPPPIDVIERIPVTSVQEAESSVGWVQTPAERAQGLPVPPTVAGQLDPASTSYALTADTNIIQVMATMRYHITDPIHFHFDFSNATVVVTNDLNNALLYAATQFPVDDVLTRNPTAFKDAVRGRMSDLARAHGLGIEVDSVDVKVQPPIYLLNKFNEVVEAGQVAKTARTEGQSYATTNLAAARGTAATRTNIAESDRSRLVQMVGAQAKEFTDVRSVYEHDPQFFKRVRQMTTLERVYTNVQAKILEPHQNGKPVEVRLNLGPEPTGSSTNSSSP